MAFKLKDILGSIKSKTNTSNIKEGMDMKYGTGDFATGGSKAAQRMKPGESQYQYNVRMQRQRKAPTKTSSTYQAPDPKSRIIIEGANTPSYDYQMTETNSNDLRPQEEVSNYGITEGMTFGDAFAQAGKMGATDKPEDAFSWTDPKTGVTGKYVYDFAKGNNEESNGKDKGKTVPHHILQVPAFADLTYEQYMKDSTNYLKGAENWMKENKI
tara:strand:- start:36 stop:674 length:639 start_codon:yes stop_codon:yes gene_type:complete